MLTFYLPFLYDGRPCFYRKVGLDVTIAFQDIQLVKKSQLDKLVFAIAIAEKHEHGSSESPGYYQSSLPYTSCLQVRKLMGG